MVPSTFSLGTGILTTALRAGEATEEQIQRAIETMAGLNRAAAETAMDVGGHACTDVTGFGFLGHLREMLAQGGVGARVSWSAVPLLPGTVELAARGIVPGGTHRNRDSLERDVVYDASLPDEARLVLCDAQTSGGLLFAVGPAQAPDLLSGLRGADVSAAEVGEFVARGDRAIQVVP